MDAQPYSDQFFDQQSAGSLASARVVLREVFDAGPIGSVVDVGCGVGPWLRIAMELGAGRGIGLDGAYVDRGRLLVPLEQFRPCDLESEDLRRAAPDGPFDLVMCLEVAEHLPSARAGSFVAELCSLGGLILFSAAIPNQGGTNHVNEQWPGYWADLFAGQEFACFDVLRPRVWGRGECEWWYVQNVLLFARPGTAAYAAASRLGQPCSAPQPLVHPRMLTQVLHHTGGLIAGLERSIRNHPFERDEGMRALEAKVDRLRTMTVERDAAASALAVSLDHACTERDRWKRDAEALRASTSWRITAPVRWAAGVLKR